MADPREMAWRAALAHDPDDAPALWGLAELALGEGHPGVAAQLLARLAGRQADHPGVWAALAVARHAADDAGGGGIAAQRALTLEPAMPEAVSALAACGDKTKGAVNWFRRAAALTPTAATLWRNLATAAARSGDQDLARTALIQALQLDPGESVAWATLCLLEVARGDLDSADAAYWNSVRYDPNPLGRLCLDADLALTRGDRASAVAMARQAMPNASLNPRPMVGRGQGIVRIHRYLDVNFDSAELNETCDRRVVVEAMAPDRIGPDDLVVIPSHAHPSDRALLDQIAQTVPAARRVVWLLDNHHHYAWNRLIAAGADRVFACHSGHLDYFDQPPGWVPCATTQWSKAELEALWQDQRGVDRDAQLHGHFGYYALASRRNRLIQALARELPDHDVRLHGSLEGFHRLSSAERFRRWRVHKVSVCLPVGDDLPYRLFDALAAGQIPIAPTSMRDLDRAIPPDIQASLPIVRFDDWTAPAVIAAYHTAIAAFDRGGEAAAWDRHRYIVDQHRFAHRLRDIVRAATA